jgi:hypothetical protein
MTHRKEGHHTGGSGWYEQCRRTCTAERADREDNNRSYHSRKPVNSSGGVEIIVGCLSFGHGIISLVRQLFGRTAAQLRGGDRSRAVLLSICTATICLRV